MRLTDEQTTIVESRDNVSVVQAGPGTGKTTTIASKIAHHLTEDNSSGYDFLAITFSRFGASELRRAIHKLDKGENWKMTINTFHGFALDIVNRFTATEWNVMDVKDLEYILDENGYWSVPTKFSDFANGKVASISQRRECATAYDKIASQFKWITYEQILAKLLADKHALKWIQSRYKYLFVDEAQDMTPSQLALAQKMGIENTMYIGDVSQAIYEWNGASPKILLELSRKHPTYSLSKNWRSTNEIVTASNSLISNNTMRIENDSESMIGDGADIEVLKTGDSTHIYGIIKDLLDSGVISRESSAVLCRTNREIESICKCDEHEIFDRPVAPSITRNIPIFRLFVAGLRVRMAPNRPYWMLLCKEVNNYNGIKNTASVWGFSEPTQHFIDLCPDWMTEAIRSETFDDYVKAFRNIIGSAEISADREIFDNTIDLFNETKKEKSEYGFLRWFSMLNTQDVLNSDLSRVRIMTIHQAKGLEFDSVVLPMPSYQLTNEEARRVVFVAMTRPRSKLVILSEKDNGYLKECNLEEQWVE